MLNWHDHQFPRLRVLACMPGMNAGGAERWLATLMRHTRSVRYTALVMEFDMHALIPELPNIPVYVAGNNFVKQAEECIAQYGADLILVFGVGQMDRYAHNSKIPVVQVMHASGEDGLDNRWHIQEYHPHFMTAVSQSAAMLYPKSLRKREAVTVIHNGSEVERILPFRGREWQRKAWQIAEDSLTLLYIGRFSKEKRAQVALRSLRYIDNGTLIMHGWGPDWEAIKEEANGCGKHVVFPIPRLTALGDVFAAADVVVVPSETEAFPLVLCESWLARKPVICSNFATIAEVEEIYANGRSMVIRVPRPPEPEDIAKAVAEMRSHPLETAEMIERAYEIAMEHFTATALVGRWESYFLNCIQLWHQINHWGAVDHNRTPKDWSQHAKGIEQVP